MPENQILARAWDPEKKIRDNQPLLRVNQASIWKRVPKIVMYFFRVTQKNACLYGGSLPESGWVRYTLAKITGIYILDKMAQIKKEVLRAGSGSTPMKGATITVHCTGSLNTNPPKKFWRYLSSTSCIFCCMGSVSVCLHVRQIDFIQIISLNWLGFRPGLVNLRVKAYFLVKIGCSLSWQMSYPLCCFCIIIYQKQASNIKLNVNLSAFSEIELTSNQTLSVSTLCCIWYSLGYWSIVSMLAQ